MNPTNLDIIVLPIGVEPVNPNLRIVGCSENACPATLPADKNGCLNSLTQCYAILQELFVLKK